MLFLLWIVVCTAHFINYKSWKAKSWKILWISETELIKFELCSKLINAKTASRNNAPTTMQVDRKFIWREIFFNLEWFFGKRFFLFVDISLSPGNYLLSEICFHFPGILHSLLSPLPRTFGKNKLWIFFAFMLALKVY